MAGVDLLVDGTKEQQYISPNINETLLQTVFVWFGSSPGWHQLSVIAYDGQGRVSEAANVQIGVQANLGLPEIDGDSIEVISENSDQPPSEEAAPLEDPEQHEGDVDAPLEDDPAPQGADQPQDGAPGADEPIQLEVDQPPLELPPQPQDAPPIVNHFDTLVDLVLPEGGGEPFVSVSTFGSASDDLGLDRLILKWQSDSGEEGGFTTHCGGEMECQSIVGTEINSGQWIFTFQAVDSSGQASQPELEIVEIIGQPGMPPAAAEHEFDPDWFREQFAGDQDVFDLGDVDLAFDQGFDIDEFLEGMFPGGQAESEEAAEIQADGDCATISIEPRADGNFVTLQVECDLEVEGEGRFILPSVDKYLPNTGDGGINLFVPEWRDDSRTTLAAGDVFTWLDWDVTCGAPYRYAVHVNSARDTDLGLATGESFAYAQAETNTPACAAGSVGDVNFRVEQHPDGLLMRWDIVGDGDWPEDLPDDGVAFIVVRFDPVSEQSVEIYHENVATDLLLAGGDLEVLDDSIQCGTQYIYSLSAIAADADHGLVSPGWLLRSQLSGNAPPCSDNDLGSLELHLTPYWFNESNVRMRLQTELPAGFIWPQGEVVELEILRIRLGADRCEGPPCRGIWQLKKRIPITDEIRLNGLVFEDDDTSVNFGRETYVYRLALFVDDLEVQSAPNVSATTPPAPPPPPEIVRLTATNNCPGGVLRCVIVEWQLYEQPRPNGYYSQAASIAVERKVGAIDQRLYPMNIADTSYIDLDPFVNEFELANGDIRQVCTYDTVYRIVAFDAQGHWYGASPMSINMPECDAPWNVVVESR